ncbi:MAG: hypothetical protein R3C40_07000 [Parvularculaceae bacterium]
MPQNHSVVDFERNPRDDRNLVIAGLPGNRLMFISRGPQRLFRKLVVPTFYFLQVDNIRRFTLGELHDLINTQADGVDIPRGDFHECSLFRAARAATIARAAPASTNPSCNKPGSRPDGLPLVVAWRKAADGRGTINRCALLRDVQGEGANHHHCPAGRNPTHPADERSQFVAA